jgi:hypothetical protein
MPDILSYRVTCIDPESGKQKQKSFSLKKYTKEKAIELGEEWKAEILGMTVSQMKNGNKTDNKMAKDEPESSGSESEDESSYASIPFRPFALNLPDDKFGCSIMLIGSTRSGKTTMLNHIFNTYFKEYITSVHTNSLQSDIYKEMKKSTIACPMYLPELMKDCYKINKATNNKYKFLHIIDDVVDKKYDKTLMRLFTYWRNSRISGIITAQEISIMNAIQRSNINFIILGRLNSDMAIEKVIKSYLRSHFPKSMNLNDCIKAYKELTSDHRFIVMDCINDDIFLSKVSI